MEKIKGINWTYVRKDGTKLQVHLTTSPIFNDKNEVTGFTGVASDITQSIEDLNEIQLLKKAIDQIGIFSIANQQGKIEELNNKFLEVSGFERDELIGSKHSILNSQHHSKDFFIDLWKTISSGKTWNGEIKNKTKSGSYYWVNTTIIPKKTELKTGLNMFHLDLISLKENK